jgi:hypothetical protein
LANYLIAPPPQREVRANSEWIANPRCLISRPLRYLNAVKIDKDSPEVFENAVASLVDMSSILFAYQIGVNGFGMGIGILYACFDAFIVIWMRKPIARFARWISPFRSPKGTPSVPDSGLQAEEKDDLPARPKTSV